ncbi:MAG: L-rhamnose mutarotase [Clostridiales bacterium]|nr:L-rhamnose mutarotase [Clostridiales bacterium]
MERYAWKGRVLPGKEKEYKRRHDEIWPEMKEMFREAGIQNYSIWMTGDELFGYYECTKGIAFAAKTQAESEVVTRWDEYMKDVLEMEMDPETGAQPLLTQVFLFED